MILYLVGGNRRVFLNRRLPWAFHIFFAPLDILCRTLPNLGPFQWHRRGLHPLELALALVISEASLILDDCWKDGLRAADSKPLDLLSLGRPFRPEVPGASISFYGAEGTCGAEP